MFLRKWRIGWGGITLEGGKSKFLSANVSADFIAGRRTPYKRVSGMANSPELSAHFGYAACYHA